MLDGTPYKDLAEKHNMPVALVVDHAYVGEPLADPSLVIKGRNDAELGKALRKGREAGLRWERLAARSGKTIAEVKKLVTAAGLDPNASWTGKGRPPAGVERPAPAEKPAGRTTGGSSTPGAKTPAKAKASKPVVAKPRVKAPAKGKTQDPSPRT